MNNPIPMPVLTKPLNYGDNLPTATIAQLMRATPLKRPWVTPQVGVMPVPAIAKLLVQKGEKLGGLEIQLAARSKALVAWSTLAGDCVGQVEKLELTPAQEIINGFLGRNSYGVRQLILTNDGAHWGVLQAMPSTPVRMVKEVAFKLPKSPTALVWDGDFRAQAHGWSDAGWNLAGGEHLSVNAIMAFFKVCQAHSLMGGVRISTPRLGSAMDLSFELAPGEFNKKGEELRVNGEHRPDFLMEGFTLRIS